VLLARVSPVWRSANWRWRLACALSAFAVLAACGYGGYVLAGVAHPGGRVEATAQPAAATVLRQLTSRADDPRPLTVGEVFPNAEVIAGSSGTLTRYRVLRVQALDRCGVAAEGAVVALLEAAGCNQVVRGTLRSPDGGYVATAGLLNLVDTAGAEAVRSGVKPHLDADTGRFRGLPAGRGTSGLTRHTTQLGWHARGHFLAYAVIARSDGSKIYPDDPIARQILTDLIEQYLRTRVLDRRAATAAPPPGRR
jgi:hypothetical protein